MEERMDSGNIPELVFRLGSDEDGVRKMAVFRLQSSIADPSFADVFISEGGLTKLRELVLHATGNTLAYSLTAFARLLETDKGWEYVNQDLVNRVVELVVTHPLVNILRGAMAILVSIVSQTHASNRTSQLEAVGSSALRPAISKYPQFLEMLVSRLSSADHALCTNALQLINSLMRDAITKSADNEWPKFIKRLQDLGVIRAVHGLMQSTALQDLAHPLLEFQALTKVLLRKWKDVTVDLDKLDHRRAIKGIYLASHPEHEGLENGDEDKMTRGSPRWQRLGFESEQPGREFEAVGFLGMMDLADFVRKTEDKFQKMLLEQGTQPAHMRCPMARASISVTAILYEHFDIGNSDLEDARGDLALESRHSIDQMFKPTLLQWSKLHTAGLKAFLRLWAATGAEVDEFAKVVELVRVLVEAVLGNASRTKEISVIEAEMARFEYPRLRELQMELFELTYEDTWGQLLRGIREQLDSEALQFIKEQRIRCLLAGAWFPYHGDVRFGHSATNGHAKGPAWRYVVLSQNRRWLYYADYEVKKDVDPIADDLPDRIDLSLISSVVSNVSATLSTPTSSETLRNSMPSNPPSLHETKRLSKANSSTRITIHGYASHARTPSKASSSARGGHTHSESTSSRRKEYELLTLHPSSHALASEWLDGLLMLLNQQPITAETNKLLRVVANWGMKIRLLNVRFEDWTDDVLDAKGTVPSRDGVDEAYYYDVFGAG